MPTNLPRSTDPRLPRWVVSCIAAAAIAYIAVSVGDWMTFFPSVHPAGYWGAAEALGAQDVRLATADGLELHGWFVPARSEPAKARTVFLHGNAGNVTHRSLHIEAITGAGSDVLVVDYRGYGKSQGRPTEGGLYLDAQAAFDWLSERGGDEAPLICHGESLGAAVAVDLAVNRPCGGVVLEAPLTSRAALASEVVPLLGPLLAPGFDAESKIRDIRAPLLVIHGTADRVIDDRHGRAVFAAAAPPKEFWSVPEAGHNDLVVRGGPEYVSRLSALYARSR